MLRALLQLLLWVSLSTYVIWFARLTYSDPERMRARWYRQLPRRVWSLKLLRGISVFWIFGGWMMLSKALTVFPLLDEYRGPKFLMVVVVAAIAATVATISNTVRDDSTRK